MRSIFFSPQEVVRRGQEPGFKPLPLPLPGSVALGKLPNVSFLRKAGQTVTHPGEGVVTPVGVLRCCPCLELGHGLAVGVAGSGARGSEGPQCLAG